MTLVVEIDHTQGAFRLQASFEAGGGITALFGRSGSGKTTLINAIAGLVRPGRGRIVLDGTVLVDTAGDIFLRPHQRRAGYVFQEGRLFPHLSVRQNLLFGQWFSRASGSASSFGEVVELLGLSHLLARRPGALSGGEKQRVAIGRALLARPRILLMDEPLAALDEARKAELMPYLERLRDVARVPIVYVSHSVAEIARLAATVVVLEDGRMVAAGAATEVLGRLEIEALDVDGGGGAVLDAVVDGHDDQFALTMLKTAVGPLLVPRLALASGAAVRIQLRARDVMLSLAAPVDMSALNVLPGKVSSINGLRGDLGAVHVQMLCGEAMITARITRKSLATLGLAPGMACHAIIKGVSLARGSG